MPSKPCAISADGLMIELITTSVAWALAKPVKANAVTWENVIARRGDDGSGGYITGSPETRQFQILRGARAQIWSIAVGTRHIERAHERCVERGIPCSDVQLVDWNERDGVRAFFAEVGGILFEVMRVEAKG